METQISAMREPVMPKPIAKQPWIKPFRPMKIQPVPAGPGDPLASSYHSVGATKWIEQYGRIHGGRNHH